LGAFLYLFDCQKLLKHALIPNHKSKATDRALRMEAQLTIDLLQNRN